MMMKDGDKVYASSEDFENWMNDCPGESVNEIVENDPEVVEGSEVTIYVGDVSGTKASEFSPIHIADAMSERAYEEVGDVAEDWLSKERDKLQQEFDVFIDKFCKDNGCAPKFYRVTNIKPIQARVLSIKNGCLDDWEYV